MQTSLPGLAVEPRFVVLSIQREHADRIFRGEKRFELRKKVPQKSFDYVFLYETGGAGLVGAFRVGSVLRDYTKSQLWEATGTLGTTRERFEKYYAGHQKGSAIGVAESRRLSAPIGRANLKQFVPAFSAPQSYLLVEPGHALHSFLLGLSRTLWTGDKTIAMRTPTVEEQRHYIEMVTREVGSSYDDIDPGFASANLKVSAQGFDPLGFLTLRKEVLAVQRSAGPLLGFTTLTYKIGGSVKTGPTVLFPEYRGHGYGSTVRALIEEHVDPFLVRKLYCTCPDVRERVLQYLLRSGYAIEAHLKHQYTDRHGEFVLGKVLRTEPVISIDYAKGRESVSAKIVPIADVTRKTLSSSLLRLFKAYGFPVDERWASNLVANATSGAASYESKPRSILVLEGGGRIVALCLLIAKRGGATKCVLLSQTAHSPSVRKLVREALATCRATKRRKIYFLHPMRDELVASSIASEGFDCEGVLKAPYQPGNDVLVLSAMLGD